MRGIRVSKKIHKLDVLLEAVRYGEGEPRLQCARGYKRKGFVWSDVLLFDRQQLVDMLKSKKKVACGRPTAIDGDFEVYGKIQYRGNGGDSILTCDGGAGKEKENLGLPLF
ncbi:MAG: hypothetical protein P8Z42_13965 [Anaerolineales bacterium]